MSNKSQYTKQSKENQSQAKSLLEPSSHQPLDRAAMADEAAWMIAAELASDPHELVETVGDAYELFDACEAVARKKSVPLTFLAKAAIGFFERGGRKNADYAAKQAAEMYQLCLDEQKARALFTKRTAEGLRQKLARIRKPRWSFDRAIKFITGQIHGDRAEIYFRKFLNHDRGLKVRVDGNPSIDWIKLPDTDERYDHALTMFDNLETGRINNYRLIAIQGDFEIFWQKKSE